MTGEWREISAEWTGELAFTGYNGNGAQIQIGSLADKPGVSPMEMLLLGLAGCTGMDIVNILQKKRLNLERFQLVVRGLRSDTYPKIYSDIEVVYKLWGADIDVASVEQAIKLSEEKYCSVGLMLEKAAHIKSSFVINSLAQ